MNFFTGFAQPQPTASQGSQGAFDNLANIQRNAALPQVRARDACAVVGPPALCLPPISFPFLDPHHHHRRFPAGPQAGWPSQHASRRDQQCATAGEWRSGPLEEPGQARARRCSKPKARGEGACKWVQNGEAEVTVACRRARCGRCRCSRAVMLIYNVMSPLPRLQGAFAAQGAQKGAQQQQQQVPFRQSLPHEAFLDPRLIDGVRYAGESPVLRVMHQHLAL